MKVRSKPQHQIDAERQEALDLKEQILILTSRIPPFVINSSGLTTSQQYKKQADVSKKIANAAQLDVDKLRVAYRDLKFYYERVL